MAPTAERPPFRYAPGFAPINRIAVQEAVQELPRTLRPLARLFLIEGILRANWQDGLCQNIDPPIHLKRGQFVMGRTEMAELLHLKSDIPIRSILSWLEKVQKVSSQSSNRGTVLTIVNFDLYSPIQEELSSKVSSRYPAGIHSKQEEQEEKKKEPFVASHEAERCLKAWEQYRPIIEKHRETYLRVFDELHRLDKVAWEGEEGIFAICAFAVKEWSAGMIQAPSKLRKPSKQYPELKTWQVIQGQIKDKQHGPMLNGKPSARQVTDEIMEKSARLEKEQGELLARRRQEAGL